MLDSKKQKAGLPPSFQKGLSKDESMLEFLMKNRITFFA